ncbi:uncharacterized protein [Petaurus breviceps papuanus]|uniref:uncharacterized protein n=1 Tax=Petaurus breviceps papuanus TaxID=3040969 RepID=UPI0036D82744
MENSAFEMHENVLPSTPSRGKMNTNGLEKKNPWSLMRIFLICLLACVITTLISVLILSLVYVSTFRSYADIYFRPEANLPKAPESPTDPKQENPVDLKFHFLNRLHKSKVFDFPGGAIQWARYRNNLKDYFSVEEEAFGTSLNKQQSHMTFGTLRIKSKGLRAPHWHFNANEHGYLAQGTAWIGVVDDGGSVVTTYNVTAGQVIFFPKNILHWIKNVGTEDCLFLLFFTTHDELQTLDVDDVFFSTPEDIASRSLKPPGGVNFIRAFQKQEEDQAVNLPPNLAELVMNASYIQSPDSLVWRYFYDLKGSKEFRFPGGIIQWARYRKNGNGLSDNEKIFSESLNQVGIISTQGTTDFNIGIGDVVFFPIGTQHYIKSTCDEDLLFILAFTTGNQLQTLDLDDYIHATADHILAQLFFKKQSEFKKIPKFTEDQAINLP